MKRACVVLFGVILMYALGSFGMLLLADPKRTVAYGLFPSSLLTEHRILPLPYAFEIAVWRIELSGDNYRAQAASDPLMTYNYIFGLSESVEGRAYSQPRRVHEMSDAFFRIGLPVDKIGPSGCTSLQTAVRVGDHQLEAYLRSRGAVLETPGTHCDRVRNPSDRRDSSGPKG